MGSVDALALSPLHGVHESAEARLVEYAGWRMPLLYDSILAEHAATRNAAAIFDVSHMGRLRIQGDWAFKLLDLACTADVLGQEDDTAQYSLLCNPAGGVIDDVLVLRLPEHWLVTCNAANRLKVLAHLGRLNDQGGCAARIDDQTSSTAMVAVQGPQAIERINEVLPFDVTGIPRHGVLAGRYMLFHYVVSRSGYTGEDGLEVILPAKVAATAWGFIASSAAGVVAAGLGARDLLRIEAGLPLYGHELNETIDPISAGLGRAVRQEGTYVGAEAIAKIRRSGPARKLVGLRLTGRRIARHGSTVLADGVEVGAVTSGTFSPSCQASIAMAYVDRRFAEVGTDVTVELKAGQEIAGQIVSRPFYRGTASKTET